MRHLPSLNLLLSCSTWTEEDNETVQKRQQQNSNTITFQHYQIKSHDTRHNKRSRVASACEQCRKRKKACSGTQPCLSCTKHNSICTYLDGNKRLCTLPDNNRSALQFIHPTTPPAPSPPPPPPPPPSTQTELSAMSIKSDADFPHYFIQEPCFNEFGYFGRSSVFTAGPYSSVPSLPTVSSSSSRSASPVFTPSDALCHQGLLPCDQSLLLDVYCEHVSTFYPMFSMTTLREQLYSSSCSSPQEDISGLNTLFFCALFARAAYLIRNKKASSGISFGELCTRLLTYAYLVRDAYTDNPTPTCSTVLALLMMANQLESTELKHQLPIAWKLAAEACTLAINMGLYANEPDSMDSILYQLRLRTFWMSFITDYTMKTIHGRPYFLDESDICLDDQNVRSKHPDHLQCTENEDIYIQRWLDYLKSTIGFCKYASRIVKFNYSPQRKLDQNHRHYRGFLSTIDHSICDEAKDRFTTQDHQKQGQQKTQEKTPPLETEISLQWNQRLVHLKQFHYLANLMLLHKRYIEDDSFRYQSRPASMEICYYAATNVVRLASSSMTTDELEALSTSPITLYSLIMALHVLQFLFAREEQDSTMVAQAEIQFERGYQVLHSLPLFQDPRSMMYHSLCHLWELYIIHRGTKGNTSQDTEESLPKEPTINTFLSNDIRHPFDAFLYNTFAFSPLLSLSSSLKVGINKERHHKYHNEETYTTSATHQQPMFDESSHSISPASSTSITQGVTDIPSGKECPGDHSPHIPFINDEQEVIIPNNPVQRQRGSIRPVLLASAYSSSSATMHSPNLLLSSIPVTMLSSSSSMASVASHDSFIPPTLLSMPSASRTLSEYSPIDYTDTIGLNEFNWYSSTLRHQQEQHDLPCSSLMPPSSSS